MKTKKMLKKMAKKVSKKAQALLTVSAWPKRAIVKTVSAGKGREGNPVRVAYLECGDKRRVDMTPRQSLRCRPCFKRGGPLKKITAKKTTKATAKAA